MPHRLAEIAALLNLPLPAGADRPIDSVGALADAGPSQIAAIANESYVPQYRTTAAGAVIAPARIALPTRPNPPAILAVEDVDLAMASVLGLFALPVPVVPRGVDALARVDKSAEIAADSAIGPGVFVGADARIGRRVQLHSGVYVGAQVAIGDDSILYPNVVVRERCSVGARVIIHAGSVLGTDGFGYAWDGKRHVKIPQIGTVIIEDDVEIGSCVCIDRAKFAVTRIGKGTKIDNLVQVGHNVLVGSHCIIVGQAGIAGSAVIGGNAILGGQSAVRDHITLGNGTQVAACAGVTEDVPAGTQVSGLPALPHRQSLREQAALRRLPDLVVTVRKLQEEIAGLKKVKENGGPRAGRRG